jgi:DNA-binding NtrC family response regulator
MGSDSWPRTLGAVTPDTVLMGKGTAARRLRERVARVAESSRKILVRGESGTGKGLVCQWFQRHWNARRIVHVRPGLEDEADALARAELARLQAAPGPRPLLIVDDLGDASPAFQRLLRQVLDTEQPVVALTRRDLETAARRGTFDETLLQRFDATVWLPPIRARRDDVPDLVLYLARLAAETLGRSSVVVTPRALALLSQQHWPGNLRQILGIIEQLVAGARRDGTITVRQVEQELAQASEEASLQLGGSSWAIHARGT